MIKTSYDPYAGALFKTYRDTGDFQEMPLSKKGKLITQVDKNGDNRIVMGPVIYLPRVTLTEWFWSAYPNGSILDELVRRDENQTIVKVTIYSDRNVGASIASSYGIVTKGKQDPDEIEKDPYNLAYYIALEGAMQKAGFLVSFDADELAEKVPGFAEKCHAGELYNYSAGSRISAESLNLEFSEPSNETLEKEERIRRLEAIAEPNASEVTQDIAKEVKLPDEKIAKLIEKEREKYSRDPIEDVIPFVPEDTEDAFRIYVDKKERILGEDSGETIVSINGKAPAKLRAFDGKRVKDLPESFLAYAANKENWNGLIDPGSLAAIKDYAAF